VSIVLTPASELRRLSMSEAKRLPVGGRIRWARARKNLSHDALAAQVGSSRSYLIRVEKGIHMPSIELRARIAVATDQPADLFQNGDSDDEEEAELVRDLVAVLRKLISHERVLV
jgi:transcriptional regulator with XRE-family HTH domain